MMTGTWFDLIMKDGTPYHITPCIDAGTPFTREYLKEQIRLGIECLSARSRWQRFFSAAADPAGGHLDYLTDLDGRDRVAWCAGAFIGGKHRGIGLARYFRLGDEPDVAEFAVTVIDSYQGQGIAQNLMIRLIESARINGLRVLRGFVAPDNAPMLALCRKFGAALGRDEDFVAADIALLPVE